MNALLVLCTAIAIGVFGYILMARVDLFLSDNQKQITVEQPTLRIAFENPAMIGPADALLESFSKEYPHCAFHFYFGARQDILGRLKGHTIDFGFLDPATCGQGDQNVHLLQIHCKAEPMVLADTDRPMLPLTGEQGDLMVVWLDAALKDPICKNFETQLMRTCT